MPDVVFISFVILDITYIHWCPSVTVIFGLDCIQISKKLLSQRMLPSPSMELHHKNVLIRNAVKTPRTLLEILKYHYVFQVQSGLVNHNLFANIQFLSAKKKYICQILFMCPIKLLFTFICWMLRQFQSTKNDLISSDCSDLKRTFIWRLIILLPMDCSWLL